MGKLAFWKGVAGAAGGVTESIKSNMDAKRQAQLLAQKQNFTRERDEAGRGHQTELQETEFGFRSDERGAGQEFTTEERGAGESFKQAEREATQEYAAEQAGLDRKSRERIAGSKAAATAASRQWQISPVKRSTMINGELKEEQIMVISDKKTGETYEQQGDVFLPQGTSMFTPESPPAGGSAEDAKQALLDQIREARSAGQAVRAPKQSVEALLQDPSRAREFLGIYGYIPAGFQRFLNQTTSGPDAFSLDAGS